MSFKEKFKANWEKVDEHCVTCGAVSKPALGINRQNMKRLLSFRANMSDFLTLIMIAMVILAAMAYNDVNAQLIKCESKNNVNTIQTGGLSITELWAYNQTVNLNNLPYNSTKNGR